MNRQLRGLVGVADEVMPVHLADELDTLRHWLLYAPDPLRVLPYESFLCVCRRRTGLSGTHEFFMVALNPALAPWNAQTILTRPATHPTEFCALPPLVHFAFGPLRDDQAALVCDGVVEGLCKGSLPMDPGTTIGGTQQWRLGLKRVVMAVMETGGLPLA